MSQQSYPELCEELFAQIEGLLDGITEDIDYESNGAICEVTLTDGSKLVINRQPPVEEIWLAAKSGGYHFRYEAGQWVDTRDGTNFFDRLNTCLALQS